MFEDPKELYEFLYQLKTAVEVLTMKVDSLETKSQIAEDAVKALEKHIIEDLFEPARKSYESFLDGERFNLFSDHHKDKLAPLFDAVKAIEGDEFDLMRQAYDGYNALPAEGRISEDEYVDLLAAKVTEQVKLLKDKLGASEVEVTAKSDGTVEVKTEDKEETSKEGEVLTVEDTIPESQAEAFADEILDSPEEIAKFERELAASLNK